LVRVESDREKETRVETCQSRLLRQVVSRRRRKGKRGKRRVLMGNDREWEAECAGEAWAGHSEDRAFWAGMVFRLSLDESSARGWEQ